MELLLNEKCEKSKKNKRERIPGNPIHGIPFNDIRRTFEIFVNYVKVLYFTIAESVTYFCIPNVLVYITSNNLKV